TLYQRIPTRTVPPSGASSDSAALPQAPQKDLQDGTSDGVPESSTDTSSIAILYIGGESLTLTNLLMTHGFSNVFSYDPSTQVTSLASGRTNRLLMRRYAAVQRARDADVFGILVGTLGVSSYLPLIRHLRTLLARHKKKSYTISVGKLNPSKLANFLEIECFVLVACPENSVIEAKARIQSSFFHILHFLIRDFLRPIVTPFELEVALQSTPNWTGRYVLNFESLLEDASQDKPEDGSTSASAPDEGGEDESDEEDQDPDRPVFSLVTGTYRKAKRYGAG
ncbi:hypothetical protein H0H92_013775, partial [Tricholoma furcatifolium]